MAVNVPGRLLFLSLDAALTAMLLQSDTLNKTAMVTYVAYGREGAIRGDSEG